ncbi:MAG: alpha-amylase family glycosyl hydrolase [Sphaerochaetaceae bacterium]|nr:alpha-amylase family glycosyl hydrolase [Sphaerochaetaceae bacterium]NLO59799.1 alpha-amylase [Spirochaetales bacterium]
MALRKVRSAWIFLSATVMLLFSSCATKSNIEQVAMSDNYRIYYEIFVASFYDTDGDGMGDLQGIRQKLDYLNEAGSSKSLGVNGLWLMPIMSSPSYHKYDVTDYYSVDPDYGTLEDFKALAAACKERNIALIIDLPINHTSDRHPWFQAALSGDQDYENYYRFRDDFASDFHKDERSGRFFEGHFGSHMPDLNLANPQVRQELSDICKFWLDAGVNGFRLDAVSWFFSSNITANVEFLSWLYNELKTFDPDVYLVGEAWSDATTILALYESAIPSFFNFPFSQSTGTLISSIRAGKGASLASAVDRWYAQLPQGAIDAPFLTNHDHARSAGALMGDLILQKQAAAVYLLLPGNPFIYYGEEIGMRGGSGRDENKRTPMIWSLSDSEGITNPPEGSDDIRPLDEGVAEQLKNRNSLLRYYIDIIAIKNRYPALARGLFNIMQVDDQQLFAYTVTYEGTTYAVVHNIGSEASSVPLAGYSLIEAISTNNKKPQFKNSLLQMPRYSSAILVVSH